MISYIPVMVSTYHRPCSSHRHLFSLLTLITAIAILSTRPSPSFLLLARADEDRARLVQSLITDAAFRSLGKHPRTGLLYNVTLPPGLAGVDAAAVRYRSGSLRRHGARVGEFRLRRGLVAHPDAERLVAVRSNLGNFSSASYERYCAAAGYRLASPVLSLLFYDAAGLLNSPENRTAPPELHVTATGQAITVSFSASLHGRDGGGSTRCAMFERDGMLKLLDYPSSNSLCTTRRQGRFALVALAAAAAPPSSGGARAGSGDACRWQVAVAGAVGGLLGVALLGLLCVSFVKEKKRREVAEMERRAYEEEVLQVSMVGHVRAPTAAAARTAPAMEADYVTQL